MIFNIELPELSDMGKSFFEDKSEVVTLLSVQTSSSCIHAHLSSQYRTLGYRCGTSTL